MRDTRKHTLRKLAQTHRLADRAVQLEAAGQYGRAGKTAQLACQCARAATRAVDRHDAGLDRELALAAMAATNRAIAAGIHCREVFQEGSTERILKELTIHGWRQTIVNIACTPDPSPRAHEHPNHCVLCCSIKSESRTRYFIVGPGVFPVCTDCYPISPGMYDMTPTADRIDEVRAKHKRNDALGRAYSETQ